MNFNEEINRKHTSSIKWALKEYEKEDDVLPFWVADMDFKAPEEVIQALKKRLEHGVFGYSYPTTSYYESVIKWMRERHQWEIKEEWIVPCPGILPAINLIINDFTNEGDSILIQRPVYNPFTDIIQKNKRKVVNSGLVYNNGRYEIDFHDFENQIVMNKVKLFILCNPQNPVGRVWTKEELLRIGDLCIKNNVLMIVDEIHHDLVDKRISHTSFASLGKDYSSSCITCTSPQKTFNLAGLKIANIIIENEEIRQKFVNSIERMELYCNEFGFVGCEAAYRYGEQWLDELLDYLYENKKSVQQFFNGKYPKIKIVPSEATYMLWIDFRSLDLDHNELNEFILKKAKLWLVDGFTYGEEGNGFMRFNIATTKALVEKGLKQLDDALKYFKDGKDK